MPRFFFRIRRGAVLYEDNEGRDLPSVEEAVLQAADEARAVLRDEPEVPADGQWVEVVDEHGNTIRTVPFVVVIH